MRLPLTLLAMAALTTTLSGALAQEPPPAALGPGPAPLPAPAQAPDAPGEATSEQAAPTEQPVVTPLPGADQASIVAVVNGDVISRGDVANRRRLFALSAGLPANPEVLARLTPQIAKQLIDEKLRWQEISRRRINVTTQEIAKAIADLENRNGLKPGELRRRLAADGVELRTLVDQVRVQIGWTRVLREVLGGQSEVSPADIAEQQAAVKAAIGQPEYRVGAIFIPIDNPANADEARKFADVVITQLRDGAPFAVAAAQFSQDQTALAGGDLGWVRGDDVDPAVLRVLAQMPVGAVSNPIRVPGGLQIVTLRAKRDIGRDTQTMLSIRQAFLPFTAKLNPQAPTEQQKQTLEQARKLSASATSCEAIEVAAKAGGSNRAADPGPVAVEALPPQMRAVLDKLAPGKASQPLVAEDGIAVVMVCSREANAAALPSTADLTEKVLGERIERASRTLLRDLQRRAVIDQRA